MQRDSMTMVQQNFHFSTQAQYPSLGFVAAQEIQNTTNTKKKQRRNLDSSAFRPQVKSFTQGRLHWYNLEKSSLSKT